MISPPHILYATSNAGSLAFSSECWLAYKEMPFEIFSNNMISLLGNKKIYHSLWNCNLWPLYDMDHSQE